MHEAGARTHRAALMRLAAPLHRRLGRSIFAKLVAVMLVMAASLLTLVAGFFLLYVSPALNASIDRITEAYAQTIAAASPSYDTATEISRRLQLQIRYDGPDARWTTAPDVPAATEVKGARHGFFTGRRSYVVTAANGGTYVFAWTISDQVRRVHVVVLAVLLLLMAAVVYFAHRVLKHVLQPLHALEDGVARLTDGQLDVIVPTRGTDEFAMLTASFNQMVRRIRTMVRTRDQLLLDVSHELRSPVTRLKVAAELVTDPDMKGRMAGDLAEMEILIGELIELERLRDGHGLDATRQNVVPMLHEIAGLFEDRRPGVRVVAPSDIPADIDAERIRTVLRNLVENAIKYSGQDRRAVQLSAAITDDQIVITVTDDGPGIPDEDLPNLFEPFYRVDRSRSKRTGGYGLGLSIAKRIVEAHGGTITAENTPPRGASFVVTLPTPV